MNPADRSTAEDLAAVRSLLTPADPVPDSSLAREDVLAARACVGLTHHADTAAPAPVRGRLSALAGRSGLRSPALSGRSGLRGRFVAAGAVAVLSVATLVALVAVPAGQDGGTVALSTGPGGKAVNAAYAATAETGTARGLLTVTDGSSTVTATGVGAFDGSKAEGEIAMLGGPANPGGAGGTTRITVVRSGAAIYAKLPAGSNPLSTDKPWVSVDAATLNRLTALALGDLGSQVTAAPLDALAYLKAFSGDVQVVGPDTVRGEATTRYRGTVDAQRVAQQLPAGAGPDAGRAAREVGSVPADLWIDGQGRLRKLVLAVDGSKVEGAPATAPIGIATVTLELWDFGTPVDASAPPADQVVDVGGLVGSFLNGVGGP